MRKKEKWKRYLQEQSQRLPPELYEALKAKVYRRDGFKCRHCNNRNGITPHHMIYRSHGGADTEENLLTLCVKCHNAHHDGLLTITWGETGANGEVRFMRQRGWKP